MSKAAALIAALCTAATPAAAQSTVAQTPELTAEAPTPRNYLNLRAGGSTNTRRPELCLEVSPLDPLGIEACGTGSGFLHQDPDPEIAHFRAKWTLATWKADRFWFQPRVALGFAELQVGEDVGGFHFTGTGPLGTETAGAEAGLFLRALMPLAAGFELVGELGVSAAYFPHAPRLVRPSAPWQPTASLQLGVGF